MHVCVKMCMGKCIYVCVHADACGLTSLLSTWFPGQCLSLNPELAISGGLTCPVSS